MSHSKHTFKNQKSTKAPDMPNLNARFLSISLSKDDQDWQSVLHTHHFTEIFYVLNGEGNFLFRDVKRPIKTGDLVIVPPYVEHTEQSIPGKSLKYYVLGLEGISFQPKDQPGTYQVFCNFDRHAMIAELMEQIYYEAKEEQYGSEMICQNLLGETNPVTATDIAVVRAQTETGYKYTIEGIVTSNASGYDKDTAFFDCIYVQDATGGICCFPVAGNYKVGDKVRITGTTEFYQGEPELQVSSITVLSRDNEVTPEEVTAAQINDRSVEGQLITLKGTVESFELANDLVQTILVKDAEGNVARVFIDGYITTDEDVKNLAQGVSITVTGLASYDDTFNAPEGPFPRIRVRDRADVVCGEAPVTEDYVTIYRVFNPGNGKHHYTDSTVERDTLEDGGWIYEGIAWYAPKEGDPIFRLYNPGNDSHLYTMDTAERDNLVDGGWILEGEVCKSAPKDDGVTIYRVYNPNATMHHHHYTNSLLEYTYLGTQGWHKEGVAWYGLKIN